MTIKVRGANYAAGTLTGPITAIATTMTFTVNSPGFSFPTLSKTTQHPMQEMYLTLSDAATMGNVTREIVKVVGPVSAHTGTITYTIIRAQDGTTAQAFAAGDLVQLRSCEKMFIDYASQGCPIGWFNVQDWGAVGDGVTDATSSIQDAIDAAFDFGGGTVYLPSGNYLCAGQLLLKGNVILSSNCIFNSSTWGTNLTAPTAGTTLSITYIADTFIKSVGPNTGLIGLIFYYPNQNAPTAASPITYPYTVTTTFNDFYMESCTTVNATHAVSLQRGNNFLRNLRLGATNNAVLMDNGAVETCMENIQFGAGLWDNFLGLSFPQAFDLYTANNLIGLDIRRADGFHITNVVSFVSKIAVSFTASGAGSAYGSLSNCDFEGALYGIVCQSTNSGLGAGGVKMANINFLSSPGGFFPPSVNAIWMKAGGATAPFLQWVNGFVGGSWTNILQYDAGVLVTTQVYNFDYPAIVVTSPAVPASTVPVTNPYPYAVAVYIAGGTYTAITINSGLIGTPSTVILPANSTIAIQYTVAPTWVWTNGV